MREPTAEQQGVLEDRSRVRVVRATPGCGKTWLVAELIRRELGQWDSATSGLAALSFTRVGGDEIRKALGYDPELPHFVGTIDAFLYRFVVRPFLKKCFNGLAEPRLIPAEWGAKHWYRYAPGASTTVGNGINLFNCAFVGVEEDKPVIAASPGPGIPMKMLSKQHTELVLQAKKSLWIAHGWVTHSDAAYLASRILGNRQHGETIRTILGRKFPLIIVDELQDTGHYLGDSIIGLLSNLSVRGVLVGDPDQSIFEFNGARPSLFARFGEIADAARLSLSRSRRCPNEIAVVARQLKDSYDDFNPAEDRVGNAYLVRYHDMVTDVSTVTRHVMTARPHATIKVIARSNQTVEEIVGKQSFPPPKLRFPEAFHLLRGVIALRQGRQIAALAAARSALELLVFGHEGVRDAVLAQKNIDPRDWKALSVRCLFKAHSINGAQSVLEWQNEAGASLTAELQAFRADIGALVDPAKMKASRVGEEWNSPASQYLPKCRSTGQILSGIQVQSVHAVKGETHDVTIFVCPPARRRDHCPSTLWWSMRAADLEEKRIAYVAMTRTKGDLFVCVSEQCYRNLEETRPDFVRSFVSLDVINDTFVPITGRLPQSL